MAEALIAVEVVYALPDQQTIVAVELPLGSNIADAIDRSGLREHYQFEAQPKVGIFGQLKNLHDELQDGDRVEILRPLLADPKVARRERAKKTN